MNRKIIASSGVRIASLGATPPRRSSRLLLVIIASNQSLSSRNRLLSHMFHQRASWFMAISKIYKRSSNKHRQEMMFDDLPVGLKGTPRWSSDCAEENEP